MTLRNVGRSTNEELQKMIKQSMFFLLICALLAIFLLIHSSVMSVLFFGFASTIITIQQMCILAILELRACRDEIREELRMVELNTLKKFKR